ncbi:hypothetical protein SY83_10075 [Paenibacillus swuensis]|uniref:Leucine-binding protein domain-containing protein n=1 Tax=Paenibacillus swuensis TaxID=1178515 RepID=A0A172THN1_9BACL|nr:ABC transporter substrate-binding protein [Paenibacillus swuensis]ANE46565.1 hypothetical protein SY83_10075 [Paenibacillus swuensis]
MRLWNQKWSVLVLSLVVGAGVLTGCGKENEANTVAKAEAEATSPILIGMSTEATGSNAETAENIYKGAQIAVDFVNEGGGINGRPVELVVRDTEENPTRGVSIVRDFGQKEKVLAALGGFNSTVMLAQSPIVKEEGFPFMILTSNVPASVLNGLPWTFGVRMNAQITAKYALGFIEKHFGTKKIAILHESGGYGKGAVDAMTKALDEAGAKPVATESFNLKDQDMTAQVARAKEAGAEVIYLFGMGASNGYVLKAMEKASWKVPVVGENGMVSKGILEVGGPLTDGTFAIQTANFNVDQTREPAKKFIEAFKTKFGGIPTTFASAAQGFDGAMILFDAIGKTELTGDLKKDRDALRETLETDAGPYSGVIKDWDTVYTKDNHDAIDVNSYLMNMWKDGLLVPSDKQ